MTRFSMSLGERPVYDQITLTTGMLMSGKMSVDIVTYAKPPRTAIKIAITTKVYGRRRASLTIHMMARLKDSTASGGPQPTSVANPGGELPYAVLAVYANCALSGRAKIAHRSTQVAEPTFLFAHASE